MLTLKIDSKAFDRDIDNFIQYTVGFLGGVKRGYPDFLNNLGSGVIETLKNYIDVNARVSPGLLKHVYEWNRVGSPDARLFDIDYNIGVSGLSINSTFRQSTSIKNGSNVPFYNKAKIMENGIPVTIQPKNRVLAFNVNGETVFTQKEVSVENPGGNVSGEYERVFDSFFRGYFAQSFLSSSGILNYLKTPTAYRDNLKSGILGGKPKGMAVGAKWISDAGKVN
jgi:hypothetical protein